MKGSKIVGQFMEQIRMATQSGLKGKDDCLDTISMLQSLKPWKPSESAPLTPAEHDMWADDEAAAEVNRIDSYIV